jgi:RecB family endonuclease NucS
MAKAGIVLQGKEERAAVSSYVRGQRMKAKKVRTPRRFFTGHRIPREERQIQRGILVCDDVWEMCRVMGEAYGMSRSEVIRACVRHCWGDQTIELK